MASSDSASDTGVGDAVVSVRNIGGIEHAQVTFEPGVSVLTGRNATNRTSLLSAIGGVLGGTSATLKSDAEDGHVQLDVDGTTYVREYTRATERVQTTGSAFTDDETVVDYFVTLLEANPVRQAIERDDPLRNVLMRPVDTDAIEDRIDELQTEKEAVDEEIESVTARQADFPALEDDRDSLESAIDELDHELAARRDEVASIEADAADVQDAADVIETLNQQRQERSRLEDQLEVKQAERDALRTDLAQIEQELAELEDDPASDRESFESELAAARERKRDLDETIASLTTIAEFNANLLSEGVDLAAIEPEAVDVPAGLAPDDERDIVCWTCGSRVQGGAIRDRLEDLRTVVQEKREDSRAVETRIDDLRSRLDGLESEQARQNSLKQRRDETAEKLSAAESTIEDVANELEEVGDAVADLETQAAQTESLRESDLLETYEQIADLQYERGQRAQQLDAVKDEIQAIDDLPDRETLEAQREEIVEELAEERARIEGIETAAVESFNKHMDELLEALAYENVARVWLERKTTGDGSGRTPPESEFDLHVVRTSNEGTGYEDDISTLSESEREVIGLVVALAGYLVHHVYDQVPFMLLDSLEAIDAERIGALVSYFATYAPYLVVALLPEDARALDETCDRISADVLTS